MFQTEVVQKIKTHLYCSKTLFRKRTVYEIIWEKYDRARKATDDNIIQRMRFACWITKVTNILIIYNATCFPCQPWFHERASLLRYTYIASLVLYEWNVLTKNVTRMCLSWTSAFWLKCTGGEDNNYQILVRIQTSLGRSHINCI